MLGRIEPADTDMLDVPIRKHSPGVQAQQVGKRLPFPQLVRARPFHKSPDRDDLLGRDIGHHIAALQIRISSRLSATKRHEQIVGAFRTVKRSDLHFPGRGVFRGMIHRRRQPAQAPGGEFRLGIHLADDGDRKRTGRQQGELGIGVGVHGGDAREDFFFQRRKRERSTVDRPYGGNIKLVGGIHLDIHHDAVGAIRVGQAEHIAWSNGICRVPDGRKLALHHDIVHVDNPGIRFRKPQLHTTGNGPPGPCLQKRPPLISQTPKGSFPPTDIQ